MRESMAERRCFHRRVVESDGFLRLSPGAQSLYLHLNMAADDDGFVIGAMGVIGRGKTGRKNLQTLVERGFVMAFGEVYVIRHWRVSNSLKNDRTKPPAYPTIAAKIWVKPNREYTEQPEPGCRTLYEIKTGVTMALESSWNPNGIPTEEKGTEGNGREPNRREDGWFDRLWAAYPEVRRGSWSAAREAARGIVSEKDREKAMESLEAWKKSDQWCKAGGQYIPFLTNWLRKGLWQQIPEAIPRSEPRSLDQDEVAAIRRLMEN